MAPYLLGVLERQAVHVPPVGLSLSSPAIWPEDAGADLERLREAEATYDLSDLQVKIVD